MTVLSVEQAFEQASDHQAQGRLQDAESLYRAILQVQANHPGANHNLGLLALRANQPHAALPYLKTALDANPGEGRFWVSYIEALAESGESDLASAVLADGRSRGLQGEAVDGLAARIAARGQNPAPLPSPEEVRTIADLFIATRYTEAIPHARAMTERFPEHWFGWKALGAAYREMGRSADAEAPMRKAVALAPGDAEAHSNLGTALRDLGRLDEAAASCKQAVVLNPESAEAHFNLGIVLHQQGNAREALEHFRRAAQISPSSLLAQQGICTALDRIVPRWHVPMMNDVPRNSAYFAALESAIEPGSLVFEIGTGSGLLAMMAARLGAGCVVTCEAEPLMAATAARIVSENGCGTTVKVLAKRSLDVDVGTDLPRKADILVSEIFSSELIGEYVLQSIADAKHRLLKPHGRVIPAAGSIMIALFGGNSIGRYLRAEDSFGFDLRHFNSIVPRKRLLDKSGLEVDLMSEDIEAFRFEFETDSTYPGEARILRIPVKSPGRCHGVLQWIRLQMDPGRVYENHPANKAQGSHWQLCAFAFPQPVEVAPGQVVAVSASHNQSVLWFDLEGIG